MPTDSNVRRVAEMSAVPSGSLMHMLAHRHEVVMRPFNNSAVVQPRSVRELERPIFLASNGRIFIRLLVTKTKHGNLIEGLATKKLF